MQVLKRIEYAEGWAYIEVQCGVPNRCKVDQDRLPVFLLQGGGEIDREGCSPGAAFCIDHGENAGFTGAVSALGALGRETVKGFEQAISPGGAIHELARPGTHGGDDVHRVAHLAYRENGDLAGSGANK